MECHRTQDDTTDAAVKIGSDVRHRTDAAAKLDPESYLSGHRKEDVSIYRMSFAGAVQIHHVDPFRTCRFKLTRRLQRIRRHLVHSVKGTLIEPHRRAVFDIDRW